MEKPVRWGELVEMQDRFLEEGRKTNGASPPLPPSGGRAIPSASVPADLADLATQFLEPQRVEVAKAHQKMERGDLRDAAHLGHNLAGTAGTFGFDPLRNLGRSLYDAACEGNALLTEDVLGEIEMYLQDVEWQVVA